VTIRKVLIIRSEAIGDVFIASGAIPVIRQRHPDCEIVFCTWHDSILKNVPGIRCERPTSVIRSEYEAVYDLDLCYELNPTTSIVQTIANLVHADADEIQPRVFLSSAEVSAAQATLEGLGIGEHTLVVALQSSTSFWARNIPKKVFDAVVAVFQEDPSVRLIHLGSRHDMALSGVVDLRGKLDLRESIAILSRCAAFAGVDSFMLHMAKSMQIPTLSFWGAVNPLLRIRTNPRDREIVSDIECTFCHHRQGTPAFITVCERQTPILKLLDTMWQRALRIQSTGIRPSIPAGVFARLLQFREKGRRLPLCMQQLGNEPLSKSAIDWIRAQSTRHQKSSHE
jgi:ADP-heptose:LPS heptosyltransferase